MPELPEVEVVARALNALIKGRTISSARLLRERLAPDCVPAEFSSTLSGAVINFVHRRGKFILLDLANGHTLLVHLRMSGRFLLLSAERDDPKFTHAVFDFEDDNRLVFADQRHFGLMKIVRTDGVSTAKEIAKLAPEPFSDEFSIGYLRTKLSTTSRSVKEFLIDQTKVCGLGNIYAGEALFAAGIDPRKRSNTISSRTAGTLHTSIRQVLQLATDGIEVRAVDPENLDGSYFSGVNDRGWQVYDREELPCTRCGKPIKRLKQGGRSTYFCPRCQR